MFDTLSYESDGPLRLVGLNRAAKRNAFNIKMLNELSAAFTAYEDDTEARCLLLFAHGEHFTAGLDLTEVGPHVAAGGGLQGQGGVDPLDLFGRRRVKPVVMALQGYAFTIGIELALACDVRVAASDTRFSQLEVGRGIMPFGGATLRFVEVAGWGNAMRWMLTGEAFGAEEALRIGLVQQVTAPGEQIQVARTIASSIASQAPLAVQAILKASRAALEHGADAAKAELMAEARGLMQTEDAAEGVRSFIERRKAVFRGR